MPSSSGDSEKIGTPHDSHFLIAVREMTSYKPHLNAAEGSESLRTKKRSGERPIRYEEMIAFLRIARREGSKRGMGAEMMTVLVNALLRDTLEDGCQLDVIARPVEGDEGLITSRREEEFHFAVSAAALVTRAESVLSDGVVDIHEARELHSTVRKVEKHGRRLVRAIEHEGRRGSSGMAS